MGYDENQFAYDKNILDNLLPGKNVTDVITAKLIRSKSNPNPVYVVFESPLLEIRHIPNERTLHAMRRSQKEVETLNEDEFNKYSLGDELRSIEKWRNKKIKLTKKSEKKQEKERKNIFKYVFVCMVVFIILFILIMWSLGYITIGEIEIGGIKFKNIQQLK